MFATDMPSPLQFLLQLEASIDSVTFGMDASNLLSQLPILRARRLSERRWLA